MSQPSSSIVSADNAETKYKKALKEISKLISANRALRESSDKKERDSKEKIDQLSLRYEDLEKQYEVVRKQKQSLAHYLDQIQKQRNNLERQVAYLNDVLQEQNAELKKLNMHKDERAVAALIRSYEEKEATLNRNRNQNDQMISKLKSTVDRLENDMQYEKNSKDEYEERYKSLSFEMNRYKEHNTSLIEQIQRLIKEGSQKDTYCVEKQKQLKALVAEFQKQVNLLRNTQQEALKKSRHDPNDQYEQVLNEKNRLEIDLAKIQGAYEEVMMRQKQFYDMEERMKSARLQAERANEEVNMLKSKIVVLQAKQFLSEAGDDDYDQKEFEERLNLLVAQNDPLNSIRNQEDVSHFRILKSFIVDLQDKIYKLNAQKKQVSKKYKSIKTKFVKNAEELIYYEQQNKIMKGKIQGYERLTQKLQFELEKSITNHEQEITRMTITSNNIITRKVDQYKATIGLLNSQLEMGQDKADRSEKSYKQEIETLRLELDTLKIRFKDETEKSNKDSDMIVLYKNKNSELSIKINVLQEQISNTNQNLSRFEHLFKEERGKNEGLLSQKQQLLNQVRQLSEEIDKKSSSFNNNYKVKEEQYEFELRKYKTESQKYRDQYQEQSRENVNLQRELEDKRRGDLGQVEQIKRQTQRNGELQTKLAQLRRRTRDLEDENESLKIKSKKFQQSYDKTNKYEQQNILRGDRINDLTREKLIFESEIKNLESLLADERKQNEEFKKQLSSLKMKALEATHESKRDYEFKIIEGKKNLQSLNQDISDLTTELREQKSKILRITNQLNTVKSEKNRLQEVLDQNRKKDLQNENQVGNIKLDLSNAETEIDRLRSQIKNQQSISNSLNQEVQTLQQKIFTFNQQISSLKMKLQSSQDLKNDLVKDLNSLKYHFGNVETHTNEAKANVNLPWAEQNFYSGLTDILSKIRKICRNYGVAVESSSSSTGYQATSFSYSQAAAINQPAVTTPRSHERKVDGYSDYFKSYADSDNNSKITSSYLNNYGESNIGSNYNVGSSKVEYNSSTSYYKTIGNAQGIQGKLTSYDWSNPTYDLGQGFKNNYDLNF